MADLTLSITIPDAKVTQAKAAFLKRFPKPTEGGDASLTDKQWIEKVISILINREIRKGKNSLDKPLADDTDYFNP